MSSERSLLDRVHAHAEEHYTAWLVVLGLAGWAMASYDFNLLVLTIPNISADLGLSSTAVGTLVFFVYGGQFVVTLAVGRAMDGYGRKRVWQWALVGTAIFTGLTFFVSSYAQLVAVRVLASGFAQSELAVSITMVNEQAPAERRGLLYSIVQGGWPVGLFLASGVYSAFIGLGWRVVFVFGVAPLVAVIAGRRFLHESSQWQERQEMKRAKAEGDRERLQRLSRSYDIDPAELEDVTFREIFTTPGPVRRQLSLLSVIWLFYAMSFVATNSYITDWLTRYGGWSSSQTGTLLLVASGIGFFFYIVGGVIGERFGRREVLVGTALLVAPLNLLFFFVHTTAWWGWLIYIAIYQVTNGTWSGAGYAYWGESFPTRLRGTAIGFLGAMLALGFLLGSGIWTVLIGATNPTITWLVVAVGLALGELLVVFLPHIEPGRELDEINVEQLQTA